MKTQSMQFLSCGFVVLLMIIGFTPVFANAAMWQDNFNQGNYTGWTVLHGEFDAQDGGIRQVATDGGAISHPSGCAFGSWNFSLWENATAEIDHHVHFIEQSSDYEQSNGYSLSIEYGPDVTLTLYRWDNEVEGEVGDTVLDDTTLGKSLDIGWHIYNITRTLPPNPQFNVYRDGYLMLEVSDEIIIASSYFIYETEEGGAIDDVSVSCPDDLTLPIIVVGVVAVIIIVVVIWWWKKKQV